MADAQNFVAEKALLMGADIIVCTRANDRSPQYGLCEDEGLDSSY
jgi:hypothetical protein